MRIETLFAILTWLHFSLAKGLHRNIEEKNVTSDSQRRVINGRNANPEDFPFLVALFLDGGLCGGSIISDYFILTAAHCIDTRRCSSLQIFPSTWVEGETEPFHAADCRSHEQHDSTKFAYDIALIKSQENLSSYPYLKILPMAAPGAKFAPGTPAVIAGWGNTEKNIYPKNIMRGDIIVKEWASCNDEYRHSYDECRSNPNCPLPNIPLRMICAQGQGPQPSGPCLGDSGGPIIINNVIAGIAAGVISLHGVCTPGTSSMFTNVADFLPWIYSIVDPNVDTSQFPVTKESDTSITVVPHDLR